MKRSIVIVLFVLTAQMFGGNAVTFEDFKKLSREERQTMIDESPADSRIQLMQWEKRLIMGEDQWQRRRRDRLIKSKGLFGLAGLFIIQDNLLGMYHHRKEEASKRSGTNIDAWHAVIDADDKESKAAYKRRNEDFECLVKLAPTPEAITLNKKADKLMMDLHDRFPDDRGAEVIITKEDITAMDVAIEEIRAQMKKLPQWTQQQIEAACAALPKEDPHM